MQYLYLFITFLVIKYCDGFVPSNEDWWKDWEPFLSAVDDSCVVSSWTGVECYKDGNKYKMQQKRDLTGNCNKNIKSKQLADCTEIEYAATILARTLTEQALEAGKPIGSKRVHRGKGKVMLNHCKSSKSKDGGKLFAGRCENSGRRKRSTSGNTDASDVPIVQPTVQKDRDILFLLDESYSIGPTDFKQVKLLTAAFIRLFCGPIRIASAKTRIGMATFDKINHHGFNFDDYISKPTVLEAAAKLAYDDQTHGSTCIMNTLKYANDTMFQKESGARINKPKTVEGMIVLITDGCANCASRDALLNMMKTLDDRKIAIIVVYIGKNAGCLEKMMALANGSHCYQIYKIHGIEKVPSYIAALNKLGCIEKWKKFGKSCPA